MRTLSIEPLIPSSLWAALALVGVLALAWYAWRRPAALSRVRWVAVIGLMGLAVALVLGVLLNPTWVRELPPPPGRPLLTVLVDATGSMATPDGGAGLSRYDAAVKLATGLGDAMGDHFDVRTRRFGEAGSVEADLSQLRGAKPSAPQTDVAAAITAAMDADRAAGQAVVLLSDGIDNVGGSPRVLAAGKLAKAVGSPIYAHTFGSESGGVDLAVDLKPPQDLVFIGQRVPVTARVSQVGLKGEHASVSLLAGGKELERKQVDLSGDVPVDTQFWVRQDKTGMYPYEVRVDPVPGEITQSNNRSTYLLRVVDQPVRVMVLEGKPYWDTKFLVRTLSSVPAVDLDSVVSLADSRIMWRTLSRRPTDDAGKPQGGDASAAEAKVEKWRIVKDAAVVLANAAELKKYQVIVLGRDADTFLTETGMANLSQWVAREGGSLVCYRGSPTVQANDALAKLLPVRWSPVRESRFHVKMTEQGREMHWLADASSSGTADALAALPALAAEERVEQAKPLATVLATSVGTSEGAAADVPAVVYQPYGTGRVVVIEGAGMWRWAFLPTQFQQKEDDVYASLWHSLLRWLVSGGNLLPGQNMTLRADKVSFASSEPATATLLVREGATTQPSNTPSIELVEEGKPAGKTFVCSAAGVGAGAWRANFGKLPVGRFQARVVGATDADSGARTLFDVRTVGVEELNLQPRPDLMARVATESGGAVIGDGNDPAKQIAASFKEHWSRLHPPRYERTTAWDRGWVLAAIFATWATAWALRRSGGLV